MGIVVGNEARKIARHLPSEYEAHKWIEKMR